MPVQLHDLTIHLSGGTANIDPNLSLGGIIAANAPVKSQLASAPVNVTGVTILDSIGNVEGNGSLTYTLAGQTLQWTPAGGTIGIGIAVAADGIYTIQSGGVGYIVVAVVAALLPIANIADATIAIANIKNSIFDDILKTESFAGDSEYRCLYMRNDNPIDTAFEILIWIASQPTGADSLALMIDPAGVGDGSTTGVAQTIANENTTPAAGAFSAPLDIVTAISLGRLLPNETAAFWIKRHIPALNIVTTLGDLSSIGFKAYI